MILFLSLFIVLSTLAATEFSMSNPWFERCPNKNYQWTSICTSFSGEHVLLSSNVGLTMSSDFASIWSDVDLSDIQVTNGFSKVVCDSECKAIYAVGHYQTPVFSSDYGLMWAALQTLPFQYKWESISCSSDCTVLYAVAADSGTVFLSTDSAGIFSQSSLIGLNLTDVDCSSDGSIAVAVQYGGAIYFSSDFGRTWLTSGGVSTAMWSAVTISGNGQYAAASAYGGIIVVSSNYAANFTNGLVIPETWVSVSSDISGQYLVAAAENMAWQSPDYGEGWDYTVVGDVDDAGMNMLVTSSGNGQILYAAMTGNCSFINNRSAEYPLPQAEFDALLDLYYATNGPNWDYQWNVDGATPVSPCLELWYGIACSYTYYNSHITLLGFNQNNMNGTLPDSIGNLTELEQFVFQQNAVSGTLPTTIGNWSKASLITISYTDIGGAIPQTIENIKGLLELILVGNNLCNPIPIDALSKLSSMYYLSLESNNFTGPLVDYSPLTQVQLLYLSSNQFVGSISESLLTMGNLVVLSIDENQLTGTISDQVYQMKQLSSLYLNGNRLNGTIPKWIGNISSISEIYLNDNRLTGSIPESICNTTWLRALFLGSNQLTSSLPPCFTNLTLMTLFNVASNSLTGSLPAFSALSGVFDVSDNYFGGHLPPIYYPNNFNISYNAFTGPIPEAIAQTSSYYLFSNNHLTGSLPEVTCTLYQPISIGPGCAGFDVSYNQFTGPLPEKMIVSSSLLISNNYFTGNFVHVDFKDMFFLVMNDNLLSGRVDTIGNMTSAVDIYLNQNQFTGSLPGRLFQLPSLFSLLLNNNQFTGNLNDQIQKHLDPSQSVLVNVDVSDNQFSGSIPGSIFEVGTLQSFAANSNCMDGSIPGEVCGALNLTTLLLDGVVAASACQTKYRSLVSGSSIYVAEKSLSGGVPECLFHLPKLTTLHLSGNGLSGRVPPMVSLTDQSSASSAALPNSLTELSLSYNRLTGRIPESIQMYPWSSLDLSYNRLDGDLMSGGFPSGGGSGSGSSQQSVSLQVNRLSGEVPVGLVVSSGDVNVLDGNMFHCNINKNQIPSRDPNYGSYECGSYSFDVSAILWGCAMLLPLSYVMILLWTRDLSSLDLEEQSPLQVKQVGHLDNYVLVSGLSVRVRQSIVVVMGFITCIVLPVCAVLSMKYDSYEYEYSWSASGIYMSGVVPAVVLLVLLIVLLVILRATSWRVLGIDAYSTLTNSDGTTTQSNPCNHFTSVKSIAMISFVVILNAIVLLGVNVAYVVIANHSNTSAVFVTQLCMAYFKLTWNRFFVLKALSNLVRYYPESKGLVGRWMVTIELCMMVFNNMVAPFVAVALVDANCFKDVIVPSPEVTSKYYASQCVATKLIERDGKSISQCTMYAEVLQKSSFAPPFTYSYQCSSSYIALYSNIFVLMFTSTAVLVPLRNELSRGCMSSCDVGSVWWYFARVLCGRLTVPPEVLLYLRSADPPRDALVSRALKGLAGRFETVFHANVFVVDVVAMLVIILTFGTVVPLIGFIGCITVCCYTYYAQYCIVRFANECDACKPESVKVYLNKLNLQFGLVQQYFNHVMSIIVPWMCVFYAFLLFDTMGSAVGAMRAMWLPVGLVCGLLLVGGVSCLWRGWSGDKRVQRARMYKPLLDVNNCGSNVNGEHDEVMNALNDEI